MKDEIQRLIAKSEQAIDAAECLLKNGFSSDAASKIYYSMFYAAKAILLSAHIEVTKHSAVESAFGYSLVKTGRIEAKYHRMLIDARKIRETADYDIQEEIIEPQATLKVEDGKAFLNEIKRILMVS
ncbi:MAG: HEPN domain-containing protein [Candidatus Eremiobacteraeota bacterium]|nr:HEPN domain-containing protein [Candidatus Eremiobacteraeota bacterium]